MLDIWFCYDWCPKTCMGPLLGFTVSCFASMTAMNLLFQDSVCLLHESSCIVAAFFQFF